MYLHCVKIACMVEGGDLIYTLEVRGCPDYLELAGALESASSRKHFNYL